MARTKNRGMNFVSSPTSNKMMRWRLGKYIRLSKEDLLRGRDESNSVINQRLLLEQYHQTHMDEFYEGDESDVYVDDGKTGTDTDREDFQRLLADVYSGKINCVIVKDLSRLSRNYTDAGNLIENLFVRLNIRFISLAEGVDSYRNPDSVSNIIVPITNVMNDQYCYQTSKKIRQVFDMKRRNGEFIGSYAPYGYIKDPQDKHALLVDPEAAEVVKSIFSMFLSGKNKRGITLYLNDHGVPCPTAYKQSQGLKYNAPNAQGNPMWSTITIDTILKNCVYVGDMVQGRQRVKSYKIHIQERVPEEEWFIVENTHEAIIDRETFNKVQGLLKRDTRTAPQTETALSVQRFSEMRRLRQGHVPDRIQRGICLLSMRDLQEPFQDCLHDALYKKYPSGGWRVVRHPTAGTSGSYLFGACFSYQRRPAEKEQVPPSGGYDSG